MELADYAVLPTSRSHTFEEPDAEKRDRYAKAAEAVTAAFSVSPWPLLPSSNDHQATTNQTRSVIDPWSTRCDFCGRCVTICVCDDIKPAAKVDNNDEEPDSARILPGLGGNTQYNPLWSSGAAAAIATECSASPVISAGLTMERFQQEEDLIPTRESCISPLQMWNPLQTEVPHEDGQHKQGQREHQDGEHQREEEHQGEEDQSEEHEDDTGEFLNKSTICTVHGAPSVIILPSERDSCNHSTLRFFGLTVINFTLNFRPEN